MSASKPRTMTEFDLHRLDALVRRVRDQLRPPPTLSALELELSRAVAVKPEEVPASVVTMNSQVEVVDLATNERQALTLVFPAMADIEAGRVSVLAPLGAALLGSTEGADVLLETPRGRRQLQVSRVVFQPEAAGRFDL